MAVSAVVIWYGTPVSVWITDVLLDQIPIDADIELGREAAAQSRYRTVYDPYWTNLVQTVGREMVQTYRKHIDDDMYHWDFAIIQADYANAFALPGGTVRVTAPLLNLVQPTRGEVAALLGHEMGHVLHRHSQARILQNQLVAYVLQALVNDDRQGRQTFGQALGDLLTKSAAWLGEQRFSRRDEYQADATSWDLLVASNKYNPQSLQSLLSKLKVLENQHQHPDDPLTRTIAEWSRTHPATEDRIRALETNWKALETNKRRALAKNPI